MTKLDKSFLIIAALFLMTAAMLSAYGFHGLSASLTDANRLSWRWATQMQTYHGLGLILVTLLAMQIGSSILLNIVRGLFVIGILIFSGGIYLDLLDITDALASIVPTGGASFMLAWGLAAVAVFLRK